MRNKVIAAIALTVAVVVWIGVSAQQEMLPRPGPGSGIVDVRGTVSVAGVTEVRVADVTDVRVTELPGVSVASVPAAAATGPVFLERGVSYRVTWPTGQTEIVKVLGESQGGGWVRVEHKATSRWVNFSALLDAERVR